MSMATDEAPEILLRHHLKKLKLPTVLREHEKIARPGGVRRQFKICGRPPATARPG